MPQWRLSFVVPALHGLGLTRKRYGHLTGVAINADGGVVISGRNKRSVEEQAESLVREVAPYGFARGVSLVLERDADHANGGKAIRQSGSIEWDSREIRMGDTSRSAWLGRARPVRAANATGQAAPVVPATLSLRRNWTDLALVRPAGTGAH